MLHRIICLIFIYSFALFPQAIEEINKKFNQAVNDYDAGNYKSALSLFNQIAEEYSINPKTSLSLLFSGKIYLHQQHYEDAENRLLRLINNFHKSKYLNEAQITLAKLYFEQKQFFKSFWQMCMIISSAENSEYEETALKSAENIAINYLSAAEVKAAYDTTNSSKLKPFLLLAGGKIHQSKQNYEPAKDFFSKLIRNYPNSHEAGEAIEILKQPILAKKNDANFDVVGIILPLNPSLSVSSAALEILEGIKYSLSEYNEGRDRKIGILIRDTELSRDKLKDIHDELKEIENLRCIIGPIFSTEVKDALEVFDDISVPIISPTATDDNLTENHINFFQANPSFSSRGRLMAQYAYFVENKRKIAILNSIDGYSPLLSISFAQEFEKLGGKIILRDTYKSGIVELNQQIKKLSDLLNQVEALYIPLADKSDIPVIVSFLSQINLNIPVYGDQDWMSPSGLESAAFLDHNLTFCSDYFIKFDDPDYQNFSKNFHFKTNTDVNRNILYGYDTMKYLLTIMRTSFSGSKALIQKMISGISSTGFHNNVVFDSNRINRYMNIVRYSNGKFELIDKYKLNN